MIKILFICIACAKKIQKNIGRCSRVTALLPMWNREDAEHAISRGEFHIDSPAIYGAR